MIRLVILTLTCLFPMVAQADEELFSLGGKAYKEADLDPATRQSLFDLHSRSHAQTEAILDDALLKKYFEEQAKKKKQTPEEVELAELKVKEPSDSEIKKFYEENKDRIPPNYTYDMVKPEIQKMLSQQKRGDKRQSLLVKVKKDMKFKFLVPSPVAPKIEINTAGFPSKGKNGAKVQIIEFADFQCPHCREASESFRKFMKSYDQKVELVFIDYPINRSGVSRAVAEGAFCAMKQNKYWEYHELAFEDQAKLTKDYPKDLAKKLKLDEAAFGKCVLSAEAKDFVSRGKNEGDRVGISGTPTIFINGKKLTSGHGFDNLKKEVDRLL